MEKEFKENVKNMLSDLNKHFHSPVIVEKIIQKFQDDNVEYLEFSK